MDIVYASDDGYAYLAGCSMLSVFKFNMNVARIRVFILDDSISEYNKSMLNSISLAYGRELIYLSVVNSIKVFKDARINAYGLEQGEGNSFTAYTRLLLGKILEEYDVDKVIYLDCDTICNGSLEELYNTNIPKDKCALAARDFTHSEYKKYLGIQSDRIYYNSGVMLIDLVKWKEFGILEIVEEQLTKDGARLYYPFADQDMLNLYAYKYMDTLDLAYNIQSPYYLYKYSSLIKAYDLHDGTFYSRDEFDKAIKQPVVIHYSGMIFIRPWYNNSRHPLKNNWLNCYYETGWKDVELKYYRESTLSKVRHFLYLVLPMDFFAFISKYAMKYVIKKTYY